MRFAGIGGLANLPEAPDNSLPLECEFAQGFVMAHAPSQQARAQSEDCTEHLADACQLWRMNLEQHQRMCRDLPRRWKMQQN
jgi:hypothetical protein